MPRKFKMNAFVVLILSILFYLFFNASKHNPALSVVNPFGEDPYDAIGSFGIQAALFLAVLSLLRAFRPYSDVSGSESRKALLARAQMMAVLAVGVTLIGDVVAMVRHPSRWIGLAGGYELVGLLGGMVFLTVIVGWLICRTVPRTIKPDVAPMGKRSVLVSLIAVFVLAIYPEHLRQSVAGELFTVIAGIMLLFVPMWALGTALVPYCITMPQDAAESNRVSLRKYRWILIALVGIFTGLGLALAELRGQQGWPHLTSHFAFVILVYVGLESAGVLIGYSFLRKPLGLFSGNR